MTPKHWFRNWWVFDDTCDDISSEIYIKIDSIVSIKKLGNCTIIGLQNGVFHNVNYPIETIERILHDQSRI